MIEYVFFFCFSFISFYLDARQLFFLSSLLLRQLHKFLSHTYTSILRTFTLRRYIFFLFLGKKSQSGFEHMRLPMYRINHVSLV